MKFHTLISTAGVLQHYANPNWVLVDCRFWLEDANKGKSDYEISHIPGAIYADLDEDLSGVIIPGETGRHPLPDIDKFSKYLGSLGIDNDTQVVAYDDRGGMIASRFWWLLKWLGHEKVAVMDGGYTKWVEEGNPVTNEFPSLSDKVFLPSVNSHFIISHDEILERFGNPGFLLVDSRAPERYRGENEPIDPIPGRIPGAVNYFWKDNLDVEECFHLKDLLRGRFVTLISNIPPQNVAFYCGSGVTSAHNILAMLHAGLGMAKLYVGSWSHWITDRERPILTGE
jgi:thiosulfate/3-mercaptopyruvate sulfurtransferase